MKKVVIAFLFAAIVVSCNDDKKAPDVSNIKADVELVHFDRDFFALDTNDLDASLQQLHEKYPDFMQLFVFSILSGQRDFEIAKQDVRSFLRTYRGIYDSSRPVAKELPAQIEVLKKGLQYTKHYFPSYDIPDRFVSFIGPIDGYFMFSDNTLSGSMKVGKTVGAGLQLYLGKEYSIYKESQFLEQYPAYVSRRFSPEYIPVNSIKLIIDDIYPLNMKGKALIELMVEAGKRLYVLDQLLPHVSDTLVTGYTKAQLDAAYANEANFWGRLVTANMLYNSDPAILKDYMNEAPFTGDLGQGSPPRAGHFIGWQIVKKWMDKTNKSLEELLKTPAKQVFEEAKYKPN